MQTRYNNVDLRFTPLEMKKSIDSWLQKNKIQNNRALLLFIVLKTFKARGAKEKLTRSYCTFGEVMQEGRRR